MLLMLPFMLSVLPPPEMTRRRIIKGIAGKKGTSLGHREVFATHPKVKVILCGFLWPKPAFGN
jgi:hypothetical protein